MRHGYDPRLSVSAAWSLEFAPVNVSVVFLQRDGNECFCIGSRSWFFEELADCLSKVREVFPWRALEHVIPPEAPQGPRLWTETFEGAGLLNVERAPDMPANTRMLCTQQFLRRLHIDTAPRAWDPDGNNADLIDSLNGYRVKELSGHSEVYTMNLLASHEQYLTRAVEHFAAWERTAAPLSDWNKPQNYRNLDKAVI